jgi:CRISPR-associated protein Csh2
MATAFQNRVFGCVIVKSINSNYNADFTHQPRTLPDGTVYATDKVLKYSVRNWLNKVHNAREVFYFKTISEKMQPRDLGETYEVLFGDLPKKDKGKEAEGRKIVLKNLLSCVDVRLFGGTFAEEGFNLSIHGTAQITHGVNRFPENAIYSEQIASPFRNANEKSADSMQTTLGTQFKLREGHYVHHFSVNPHNLTDLVTLSGGEALNDEDIAKLKAGLSRGVTLYDSSAKSGTENELLLWVQLKPNSKLVLPSFVELVSISDDDKRTIDLSAVSEILARPHVKDAVEKIEIWYDSTASTAKGVPAGAIHHEIHQ